MLNLTIDQIISNIRNKKTFEACPPDNSFRIKIEDYTPYVCTAVHAGHNLLSELNIKCALSNEERWYEEDPETDKFISSFPIVIVGNDSRYEYDINRNPKEAIYDVAWGKKIWITELTESQRQASINKHNNFYKVVYALIEKLESMFGACIVFDIHSYNYKRIEKEAPVFNIGAEKVQEKYKSYINQWNKDLKRILIPNFENTVEINNVFYGRGYLNEFITDEFDNTLVLPTEIKKIYCNELEGTIYPQVVEAISNGLKKAVLSTSVHFSKKYTKLSIVKKYALLSSELDKDLEKVDKQLFHLVKDFEILNYVNPVNVEQEKRRFFQSKFTRNPEFRYRQIIIDPFEFKKKLYEIPVDIIKDVNIQRMYKDIIDAYADKVDMISTIGTDKFLYNSLRYFGEPGETDINNANYLLFCPELQNAEYYERLDSSDIHQYFNDVISDYGFDCKVEVTRNTVSKVMVLNSRKTIRIRKDARFTEKGLNALAEHEVGVHMLTTINARTQPLKMLWLGMPVNTLTQEGLAILSEYLSGNITLLRLKELALRVLAIKHMLKGADFAKTFNYLQSTHVISDDKAFYMTLRVFRGGGFTKDYLYMKGFREILNLYNSGTSIDNLLIGKTSLKYLPVLNELIERKILLPPKHKTRVLLFPNQTDPIIQYVVSGIQNACPEYTIDNENKNLLIPA